MDMNDYEVSDNDDEVSDNDDYVDDDSCKSVQGDGAASITRQDSISACGIL